jgi:hypothetical protein
MGRRIEEGEGNDGVLCYHHVTYICSCWSALRYTKLFNEVHLLDEKIEYATLIINYQQGCHICFCVD